MGIINQLRMDMINEIFPTYKSTFISYEIFGHTILMVNKVIRICHKSWAPPVAGEPMNYRYIFGW